MARSKEQWKAQKRAMHTQPQSNSFFQMKRSGMRPMAPSASSALFQLGRPQSGANSVRPVVKPDPIQMPSSRGASSGEAIDLTLDDDDEEDEPMGDQADQQPPTAAGSSAASDVVKLSMLDGVSNEASVADTMVPLAEDVESDVDEEWPSVPPSVSEQDAQNQMTQDVTAALDAIRKTVPYLQEAQGGGVERNMQMEEMQQQTDTPPLYGDEDMEADVDEELPNQAAQDGDGEAGSPAAANRVVQVEHLEDGEIFEEGAAPKSAEQVQQAILLDRQLAGYVDDQSPDARPHVRHKKQKKRGKKKTKRKLEAMHMMHASSGEVTPEFERMTRLRQFEDTPPPGQYTLAMMRSGPRGEPMNVHPVFQDPQPPQFHPGGLVVGVPRPPMRSPPPQFQNQPLAPPYGDSQILRVNRQGSMEMLDGNPELQLQPMFLKPPPHGGFQYRSVSMSPPRPIPRGSSQPLQRSASDYQRLPPPPPFPTSSRDNSTDAGGDPDESDDFDLDSLRAAALRTKIKRNPKTSTPIAPTATDVRSLSSPSSPKSAHIEQTHSAPASPEIDKLRLEILRSMQRNRGNRAGITAQNKTTSASSVGKANLAEKPSQSVSTKTVGEKGGNNTGEEISSAAVPTDSNVAKRAKKSTQPVSSGTTPVERVGNDGSSCETDKSTTASEQNETSDKVESPAAVASESGKPSAEITVKTPEFRPLTACSQSLVIRLSPEDFSPRKTGNDTRTKATASSTLQDAIKEMRRKIAEREKEQTNRLLESAAVRLSKQSSETGSSPSPASPSPSKQLSPGKKSSIEDAQPSSSSTPLPEVNISAVEKETGMTTGKIAREPESNGATDIAKAHAKLNELEDKLAKQASRSEVLSPSEELKETGLSAVAAEPRSQALNPQERAETSGVVPPLASANGDHEEKTCDVLIPEKAVSRTSSVPERDSKELDFEAIRAEIEQCVNECELADLQIARLSKEKAQLEKQLPPAEATVGGS